MEPERWRRLEDLLHAALERPAAEQAGFLAQACGPDATLLREATALLRADENAGGFLGRPLLDGVAVEGRRIGPYRLERKLGEGGTSAVYLAQRDDDHYRRQVAVKLVRFGMDSEEHLRRFRAERQILAHLEHPNVARLYDGGTTDDGLPYLAMELVEGEPIDTYCDRRRLTVRQRLELFRTVCSAVRYAHQNLIVHRDLKPSNVLVTTDGVPKLLDFGIAKLLDPAMAPPGARPTRTWQRLLTPDYASPEQVRGEAVTTASDVYSLGVLLYELLTGRLPHRLAGLTPQAIERVLGERRPLRPSAAVCPPARARGRADGAEADRAAGVEAARARGGLRPQQLRRRLAGDLDNIVTRALHPDPARRYGSAEPLSDDLRRHLSGQPVAAHPDSLAYRAGKFLRRHRVGVGFAALLALLVATATVLLAVGSERLAHERNQAQLERDKARQVAALLEGVFNVSDPWTVDGRAPSAKALLDRAAEELRTADPPSDVQAALMTSMGRIYRHHGEVEIAEELMTRAYESRLERLGPDHPEVADSLSDLGMLHRDRGDLERAIDELRRALAIRVEHFGEPSLEAVQSSSELAIVQLAAGEHEEAEALDRRALAQLAALPEAPAWLRNQVTLNLGQILYAAGRYEEAEATIVETLAGLRAALGEEHPGAIAAVNLLAGIRYRRGNLAGARSGFGEALDLSRRVFGDDHSKVAVATGNLAIVLSDLGRHDEAVELHRRTLDLRRRTLGEQHPEVAAGLHNLASALRRSGDPDAAEPLQRQALALRRRTLGEEHPHVAADLSTLGWILLERGDPERAEPLLREALRRRREQLDGHHPSTAEALVGLGRALTATGALEEAEALLREAVDIRRRRLPAGHWHTAAAESSLGACLSRQGSDAEAGPLLAASYRRLAAALPAGDPEVERARRLVGELEAARGRPAPG